DLIVGNGAGGLAAVGAVRAGIPDVGHFPRARLVAIGTAGERADGTDVDAHAALFAGQLVRFVGQDHGQHAARPHAERFHIHALVADAHAPEAENTAWRVVIDQRRPFLLGRVELFLDEAGLVEAVAKRHVLQFALAALVADR